MAAEPARAAPIHCEDAIIARCYQVAWSVSGSSAPPRVTWPRRRCVRSRHSCSAEGSPAAFAMGSPGWRRRTHGHRPRPRPGTAGETVGSGRPGRSPRRSWSDPPRPSRWSLPGHRERSPDRPRISRTPGGDQRGVPQGFELAGRTLRRTDAACPTVGRRLRRTVCGAFETTTSRPATAFRPSAVTAVSGPRSTCGTHMRVGGRNRRPLSLVEADASRRWRGSGRALIGPAPRPPS